MAGVLEKQFGGSPDAIRHHYDVSTQFYRGWLCKRLVYSCAMWEGLAPNATLEQAQYRKLEHHADQAGALPGTRILDVGCGWGSMLNHLVSERGIVHAEGLTLSKDQHDHIICADRPEVSVQLKSWTDYEPKQALDGIISIGAFEHFADPSQTREERQQVYRDFLSKCFNWLKDDGRLSLQTIAYGKMEPDQANPFIANDIFPNAELPFLSDITKAAEGVFETILMRNDAVDYARTCEEWARRLKRTYKTNPSFCSKETYEKYMKYLRLSAVGFRMGKLQLLRFSFSKPGWHRSKGNRG